MVLGTKSALDKQHIQTLFLISQTDIPTQKLKKIMYENFHVNKQAMCGIVWNSQEKCEQGVGFFFFSTGPSKNVMLLNGLFSAL